VLMKISLNVLSNEMGSLVCHVQYEYLEYSHRGLYDNRFYA
jgi:hypothetical protein